MNILFILLGCNIYSILLNRLETSFDFINKEMYPNTNINKNTYKLTTNTTLLNKTFSESTISQITWFLSGGIKNDFKGAKSEASLMKSQIDNIINLNYDNFSKSRFIWNYILDEKSTNTAENFIWASQFLNTTTETFDSVYIITSTFHYERASMMLNLIDSSRNFKWILGDLEEKDSKYWESIHIMNVESDVLKAKKKYHNSLYKN